MAPEPQGRAGVRVFRRPRGWREPSLKRRVLRAMLSGPFEHSGRAFADDPLGRRAWGETAPAQVPPTRVGPGRLSPPGVRCRGPLP